MKSSEDLQKEFENFNNLNPFCSDGSCETDEDNDLKDYPNYTDALYAKLMAPMVSGIYISKWDIKEIALAAGESMAIHPRKRMFELAMKYTTNKENMQLFLAALENHMEEKIAIYEGFCEAFPTSHEIFAPKIERARKTIASFPKILEEYFES